MERDKIAKYIQKLGLDWDKIKIQKPNWDEKMTPRVTVIRDIVIAVRPTFIECPNVKGCHTVKPKGRAHKVPRPLKQPRSLNCKSFWKISALTHPFSLHRTSVRVWRSTQVQVSPTSVSRSRKLVLEPSLSKLFLWFMSGLAVWIQSPFSCHCFSS